MSSFCRSGSIFKPSRRERWSGIDKVLKWLAVENPSEDDVKNLVIRMRKQGLKTSSCNSRARSINAYLWLGLVATFASQRCKKKNGCQRPSYQGISQSSLKRSHRNVLHGEQGCLS
jgi:hypothetical protein